MMHTASFTPPATTTPLTIGILGGGQLGRMLAQAALPLGIRCVFLEPQKDCPAAALGTVYSPEHPDELHAFLQAAQCFTLEFENIALDIAHRVAAHAPLWPTPQALEVAQNRLREKALFDQLHIPVPPYAAVNSEASLHHACTQLGLPLVLKTATGGYDGKGQYVIRTAADIADAWQALGPAGQLIAESFVYFSREVSINAVRSQEGVISTWPLAENHHHHGILSHSVVPAPESTELLLEAQDYIARIMNHLNYVGVLTLELFVTEQGLMANEIAPRVHNSGHYSIEGAVCSQFENHMRAVAGLPLGATEITAPSVMINIIGQHPNTADILQIDGAHLHLYGKAERAGRKLGHITLLETSTCAFSDSVPRIAQLLPEPLALAHLRQKP